MENCKIFTAKTVEDAIEQGLAEMGLAKEQVEIEVIDEGKKKLFGSIPAQVKITEKSQKTDGERAVEFLTELFVKLGQEVEIELSEEDKRIVIELDSEKTKGLIGRRGEVIDAIQTLASAVANIGRRDYIRVVVDCGNYREDREETLKRVAEKTAAKAVKLGKRMRLEPMNPYERRVIHAALADNEEVTTKSEGKEPARFVVITPKNAKPFDKNGRGGKGKFDRNNKNNRGGKGGYNRFEKKSYEDRELPQEGTPESSGTSFKSAGTGYRKGSFNGFFGTFLGNSRNEEQTTTESTEGTEE